MKPSLSEHPPLAPGQAALLCSDGAWLNVQDEEWCEVSAASSPADALAALLEQAVERGGDKADNTSALLLVRSA